MARALTNAQGETQVGKNGKSPLGQYFESKASADKVKAGAAAVTDRVGAVAAVFSPYAALSSLGGQIMRAIEHYNDCESLRVRLVDTKDRLVHYHATLRYDNLDRPQLEVEAEYGPGRKQGTGGEEQEAGASAKRGLSSRGEALRPRLQPEPKQGHQSEMEAHTAMSR